MFKLNPNFFEFSAGDAAPILRECHYYDYKTGKELDTPEVELGSIRKVYPACIGPYYAHEPLLLREDVIYKMKKVGLTGFSAREVNIVKINRKNVTNHSIPKYYLTTALGMMATRVELYEKLGNGKYSYEVSGDSLNDPHIKSKLQDYGKYSPRLIPQENEWDGKDFFNIEYRRNFGQIHCSRRFVELAYNEPWDNLSFKPLDSLGSAPADFRQLPWSPEQWYPPFQLNNQTT